MPLCLIVLVYIKALPYLLVTADIARVRVELSASVFDLKSVRSRLQGLVQNTSGLEGDQLVLLDAGGGDDNWGGNTVIGVG